MRTCLLTCFVGCFWLSGCSRWELESKKPWTDNSPELVLVAGGTFQMGSNDGTADEKPVHSVTLKDFYIGKYEITVKQYQDFCTATSRVMPINSYWYWQDDNPVVFITLDDANRYCTWLSQQTGKRFRLPTEAEWEYAAKGGTPSQNYMYAGSNTAGEVAWYGATNYKVGDEGTHPVGRKKPNQLGIYDMSGNAWEWCSDWHGPYPSNSMTNPTGPISGTLRVFRGGSWGDIDSRIRVSARFPTQANVQFFTVGFRVARDL